MLSIKGADFSAAKARSDQSSSHLVRGIGHGCFAAGGDGVAGEATNPAWCARRNAGTGAPDELRRAGVAAGRAGGRRRRQSDAAGRLCDAGALAAGSTIAPRAGRGGGGCRGSVGGAGKTGPGEAVGTATRHHEAGDGKTGSQGPGGRQAHRCGETCGQAGAGAAGARRGGRIAGKAALGEPARNATRRGRAGGCRQNAGENRDGRQARAKA